MSSQTRDLSAKWMRRHQARLSPSHVLEKSKLMEIAMSMIVMLIGGGMIKVYSKGDVLFGGAKEGVAEDDRAASRAVALGYGSEKG